MYIKSNVTTNQNTQAVKVDLQKQQRDFVSF